MRMLLCRVVKKVVGSYNVKKGRKAFNEALVVSASLAEQRRLDGLSMQWLGKAQRAESKALKFPEDSKRREKLEATAGAFKSAHSSMHKILMSYDAALARAKTDEQRLELAESFAKKRKALESALNALLKAAKRAGKK